MEQREWSEDGTRTGLGKALKWPADRARGVSWRGDAWWCAGRGLSSGPGAGCRGDQAAAGAIEAVAAEAAGRKIPLDALAQPGTARGINGGPEPQQFVEWSRGAERGGHLFPAGAALVVDVCDHRAQDIGFAVQVIPPVVLFAEAVEQDPDAGGDLQHAGRGLVPGPTC